MRKLEIFRHLRKGVVAGLPRQQMSSFQQKLALKGSETSIEYFASVLKDVKDRGGWNTASALVRFSQTKKNAASINCYRAITKTF